MPLIDSLDLDDLTASRLCQRLEGVVRAAAARALYRHAGDDPGAVGGADAALARALKFRPASVRKMPAHSNPYASHQNEHLFKDVRDGGEFFAAARFEHDLINTGISPYWTRR